MASDGKLFQIVTIIFVSLCLFIRFILWPLVSSKPDNLISVPVVSIKFKH